MSNEMKYEKGLKSPEESMATFTQCVRYEDINGYNRLFGGRLMEWIDEEAGIAAARHCGSAITTAAVDNFQFKSGVKLGDIVVIIARVTYVGRTSLEVRADTYVEDIATGMRKPVNRAYFTEVCIDEEGNPRPIPWGLKVETECEKAEYEGALKRIALRKQRRLEGF